jgi:general secretion pathway protein K
MTATLSRRSGFALLAVLWVITAAAALGLTISLAAHEAVATARNRVAATRGMWGAEACLERTRAAVAEALASPLFHQQDDRSPWLYLDSVVATSPFVTTAPCTLSMRAAGTSLNVNEADDGMVQALAVAAGIDAVRADSLTAALLDWRDADDLQRPLGAERDWYVSAGRAPPRNASLADARELRLVRGFETASQLDLLLGVDPGRVPLAIAPIPVIAALPGIGEEALARIAERRLHTGWPRDAMALAGTLSQPGRDAMLATFADLSRWTTAEPDAWVLTGRAGDGLSPVSVVIEVTMVRAGTRAAIVRRRSWIE